MRQITKFLFLTLIIVGLLSGCSFLSPEPVVKTKVEEVKVAVVDNDELWTKSDRAEEFQQRLEEEVEKLRDSYEEKKESLKEQQKIEEQQKLVEKVNKVRDDLRDEFNQRIKEAIEKVREEEGFDIVLDKQGVQYGGIDITEEVINQLDQQ